MGFLKKLFGNAKLDGAALARSAEKADYAHIALLAYFAEPQTDPSLAVQQRWGRVLPQSYAETLKLFEKQGWLEAAQGRYKMTATALPFVQLYRQRQAAEKAEVMPKVRKALTAKDASEALSIRRAYEARQPIGQADWTGEEPQLSHSALTRRIFFLEHWLLDNLSKPTLDWLKLYAAEQHLWGTTWRLPIDEVPETVQQELAKPDMDGIEAAKFLDYQHKGPVDRLSNRPPRLLP